MSLRAHAHLLVLTTGMVVVATVAILVAVDVTEIVLDETLYKQSAVHYTTGLPDSLFHDLTARATARLYPLLMAPFFAVFDGDVAVRWARAVNGVFFAASALPVYLLARQIELPRWPAVFAALASIAVPWLTLATAMFTESLSLLIFAWTLLAMVHALRRPLWWRDALVLLGIAGLICTRAQLVSLLPAWMLAVAVREVRAAGGVRAGVRTVARNHPLTAAVGAAVLLLVLLLAVDGSLHHRIQEVFGRYSEFQDRSRLPSDAGLAALYEVVAIGFGVGLLPLIAAVAWTRGALAGRLGAANRDVALVVVILLAVLCAATLAAQNGYLGRLSEERYYIYAVPLVWIAAVAAWRDERVALRWLVVTGVALALVMAAVPISVPVNGETFVLAPASATIEHLMPRVQGRLGQTFDLDFVASRQDLLMYGGLALTAAIAVLYRRRRARWLLAGVAVAGQLAVTAYAIQGTRGELRDVDGRTDPVGFAGLGWVDRATPSGTRATWLDNQVRDPSFAEQQRQTLMYNDEIAGVLRVPEQGLSPLLSPLDSLPARTMTLVGPSRGLPLSPEGWYISRRDSPFLQPAGRVFARGFADTLELVHTAPRERLRWAALALASDGLVDRASAAQMLTARGTRFDMELAAPDVAARTSVTVRAGGSVRRVRLGGGTAVRHVTMRACGPHRDAVVRVKASRTTALADGRQVSAAVRSVRVDPVPAPQRCPR